MLFSLLIRNFKVFRGWHYIPISYGENFSAFIGENGVGKSSILEALNTFFNKPTSDWNYNHSISKSGFDREPTICPIFLIKKSKINKNRHLYKYLNIISDITWQLEKEDFQNAHRELGENFISQVDSMRELIKNCDDEYFLFPCGIKKTSKTGISHSIGIFEQISYYDDDLKDQHDIDLENAILEALSYINEEIDYIHIPSEIDYETYTKIEGKTIQSLMGTSVDEIIKEFIDEKVIKDINVGLDSFLSKVEDFLEKYEYKKPAKRQTPFNLTHLTSKIIETYFESKVLNLNVSGELTPIYNFSSGEKRKAIIDLARAFLLNANKDCQNRTIILAMDEPEVSLHTSACFEQFEKIDDISNKGVQTLIATHWYGFVPAVSTGSAIYIADDDSSKKLFLINLSRFRDDIKQIKRKTKGRMPSNIELKSINDLVQSIISSITRIGKKWIICEGASDKIYLEHLLKNKCSCIILPIGGSKYVKRIYEYIYLALEEERSDINGKVFCLLDTDKSIELYNARESIKALTIRRLQNCTSSKKVKLSKTSDNSVYPPTEIEDVLNPSIFKQVLIYFNSNGYDNLLSNLISELSIGREDAPSGLAFDLRDSEKATLEEFFNLPGIKIEFAKKYCELDSKSDLEWANEIAGFIK